MITYNHEAFVAQAIESIMMQETDFDFELIIGEDCSTDNTRNILLDYQTRFPDKIKLILPKENLGMMKNFSETLKACCGDYVALCEGDDYWTSKNKLQRQVDFLNQNEDFSIVFHAASINNETTGETKISNINQKPVCTIEDLFVENFIITASCMFRNRLFPNFPDFFLKTGAGDWVLHILNAEHGKIGFINEVMAVYRIHEGGTIYNAVSTSAKLEKAYLKDVSTFESINSHFKFRFSKQINKLLGKIYQRISILHVQNNNRKAAIFHARKSLLINFNITTAAYLIPLVISPSPMHTYQLIKKIRGKKGVA
jgi:glycosyltransferase involved in cell wall biosynthesis